MAVKECDKHCDSRKKLIKRIIGAIIAFIVIVLLTILIVWAVLQPKKPRFVLQDVTVFAFNVSQPNFLTSNFQVTLSTRNPNRRIGIYYDRLHVYATYRSQQITLRTAIPPTYQGHKEVNVWSPFIYGTSVPVAPYNSIALNEEQAHGAITLMIRAHGRVRWKVGAVTTGGYHLDVDCPAFINLGNRAEGIAVGENAVKYTLITKCSVSV